MENELMIRRMTLSDVPAVAAIEAATFPMPWTEDNFRQELTSNAVARYLVAEKDGAVIGFAGAWVIIDEAHITNIAILAEHRGRGYGKALTAALMQYIANLGAAYATLEVRKSNITAQNLYKALGYVTLGVRKRYYEDNGEDALLMVCDHMPTVDPDFEEEETVRESP